MIIGEIPAGTTWADSTGRTWEADGAGLELWVYEAPPDTMRGKVAQLISDGLPDGVYVYDTPPEQVKAPAVVVGTMSWEPRSMSSLKAINWSMAIEVVVTRRMPSYVVKTLEDLSLTVARALLASGYRVEGFDSETSSEIGGADYLSGTLTVIYQSDTEE